MIDLQQVWQKLGGETFVRNAIEKAAQDSGVPVSAAEVKQIVNDVSGQVPQIIQEVEQESAQNMAREIARREYHRFCRAAGVRPNNSQIF